MPEIFLTRKEKDNLNKWKYEVIDNSIISKFLDPFWNYLQDFVPATVSPNIITVSGFLCVLYAFHLCYNYINIYPKFISMISCFLIFCYMNLDSVDGKHARKTRNSSPLGELLDHGCDSISVVFLILILCYILGIDKPNVQWYLVQIAQLFFLNSHINAFVNKIIKFGYFDGPVEFLIFFQILIIYKTLYSIGWILPFINNEWIISKVYYATYFILMFKISVIENHYESRNGLLLSLLARFIPSFFIYFGIITNALSTYTIISHGLVMSVIAGDIILAKMVNRELHPLVPLFVIISLFDNMFCIIICVLYYLLVMTEMSNYLRISIFGVHHNVYCSGVFDLCHEGHMNLFAKASSFGTKLLVGVHNDKDVANYKREPILNHEQRCSVVSKCKFVDEIIPNAELYLTKDFINKHNIHVVLCSSEYDVPEDKYYEIPRKMNILIVLPRTESISTSDLMKKIRAY